MKKKSLSILFINSVVALGLATALPLSLTGNSHQSDNISKDNYSSNLARSGAGITNNDISNDFRSFANKSDFQLFNTNNLDLKYENLPIGTSNNFLKLRAQVQYFQNFKDNYWVSNNLNHVDSDIPLLSFQNINSMNYENKFQNLVDQAIGSVWSTTDDDMPEPWKASSQQGIFEIPRNSYPDRVGVNIGNHGFSPYIRDLSHTKQLFGPSQNNNESRKWNYYSVLSPANIWGDMGLVWNINPVKRGNKTNLKNKIINKLQPSKLELSNNSFKYSNLAYKTPEINELIGTIEGQAWQEAHFKLFDNSLPKFQTGSVINRSLNDWYNNNYIDYTRDNPIKRDALGNFNTVNKVENIYVDFSKLLKIDDNLTTAYATSSNDAWTTSNPPQLVFGWNTELFGALKEVSLLATWVKSFYNHWNQISSYSTGLKANFERLIDDIYNERINSVGVTNYIQRVRSSNGVNNTYNSGTTKAEYSQVLSKNSWTLHTQDHSVNSWGLTNIVNDLQKQAFVYDYVLPQVFKNDIYANYQIQGSSEWVSNELNTKIYDGSTKTFKALSMIDYGVARKTYNNDVSMFLKNFYMKDVNTNAIIVGTGNQNNNTTLSAWNIANVSNSNTKTKSSYDGNNAALKVTWKWNPGLNIVSNVTTNAKTRALDTPWYFVNQTFGYGDVAIEKREWLDFTNKVLKLPTTATGASAIDILQSFGYARATGSQWASYPELVKSSELASKFSVLNIDGNFNKEYYDARRELDNLGYIYLNVESRIPLNYYLSNAEYNRLQKDNTFIENGKTSNGLYKYFVKYSFKAKPLKLADLAKYITIKFSSSNQAEPTNKYANKALTISFNTKKMQEDLAGLMSVNQEYFTLQQNQLHEFFDVTYDELWSAVLNLVKQQTQNTDWHLNTQSFRFVNENHVNTDNYMNNWFYENKWEFTTNGNTTFSSLVFKAKITTKYKPSNFNLANTITLNQGDTTISEFGAVNDQLTVTQALTNQINDLRVKYNDSLKTLKQLPLQIGKTKLEIRKMFETELNKSETLKVQYDTITEMYDKRINEVITTIKANYDTYLKDNNYVSNGFVSSTLTKSFDYKKELLQLKTLYTQLNVSLNNLLTDGALKAELKAKAQELTTTIQSSIDTLNNQLNSYTKQLAALEAQNTSLNTYANQLTNFTSNQNITVNLAVGNNAKLAINTSSSDLNGYWVIETNQNYQELINKNDFINKINDLINSTIEPIVGVNIRVDESMFKLQNNVSNKEITGYKFSESNKTINAKVVYSTSNGVITKWQLLLDLQTVSSNNARVADNSIAGVKQTLNQIKNLTVTNHDDITNLANDIKAQNTNLTNTQNTVNGMGNVDLPNIFGTSDQAAKLDKLINDYQTINYSKTKLNDGFIGTVIGGSIAGILIIVGTVIFLLSLRNKKTVAFTDEEKAEIQKAVDEFNGKK